MLVVSRTGWTKTQWLLTNLGQTKLTPRPSLLAYTRKRFPVLVPGRCRKLPVTLDKVFGRSAHAPYALFVSRCNWWGKPCGKWGTIIWSILQLKTFKNVPGTLERSWLHLLFQALIEISWRDNWAKSSSNCGLIQEVQNSAFYQLSIIRGLIPILPTPTRTLFRRGK